ncbi:hypothetical protein QAD02_014029 [Eretmocerus hayati]|uniref:Uncharacterized protein n=1 Tax=Eretmocerus hayati TaxID=131215 RepID=A0ACC2P4E6_9HYME|nr:hypothetical protein QAD02_014029 [Eretmocerus hayati]
MVSKLCGPSPTVMMQFTECFGYFKIIVDTGAGPSLLELSKKPIDPHVAHDEIIELTGITAQSIRTLGKINLQYFDLIFLFHLIQDNFPMAQDGLLGSEASHGYRVSIDYARGNFRIGGYQIPILNNNWSATANINFTILHDGLNKDEYGVTPRKQLRLDLIRKTF